MAKGQGAALDRKKLLADPIMVTTIVVLIAFLTLFILYPLAILLVDSIYGKANCTDGIHVIMPKQTIVQAFHLLAAVRKEARRCDKENNRDGKFFSNRVSELP